MATDSNDISNYDYAKLAEEVIRIWRLESKENTLRLLSDKSTVGYTWIRLIAKGGRTTSLDTFYRLITAMWPLNKVKNILLEHSEHGADVITELEKVGVVFTDVEFDDLREATFYARIVALEKQSIAEIEALLGSKAPAAISKLEGFGVIAKNTDDTYGLSKKFLEIRSSPALKMLARLIVECHDLEQGDEGETRIQGLNARGIGQIREAVSAFKILLIKILTDPLNQGNLVFGITLNTAIIDADRKAGQSRREHIKKVYQIDDQAASIVARLVHDIRSPFSHVQQYLEAQTKADAAAAEAKRALIASRRVEMMIDSLRRKNFEEIVTREKATFFMADILELADCLASDYKKTFSYDGPGEFEGFLDAEKLDHSLQNLITNAFEAAHSMVRLECVCERDSIIFTIIDDGPGVPEHLTERLFTRDFTHGKEFGTGIGLWKVRQMATGHDGEALYERKDGLTRFSIILRHVLREDVNGLDPLIMQDHRTVTPKKVLRRMSEARLSYLELVFESDDPDVDEEASVRASKPLLFLGCKHDIERPILLERVTRELPQYKITCDPQQIFCAWLVVSDDMTHINEAIAAEVEGFWSYGQVEPGSDHFFLQLHSKASREFDNYCKEKAEWLESLAIQRC